MKVLFLDIDGVLNTFSTTERFRSVVGVCPVRLARFLRILEETGCSFVLSSTWRKYKKHLAHLQELWGELGRARFLGTTPVSSGWSMVYEMRRGEEIDLWLKENQQRLAITKFVILDDDGDMAPHMERLIQTNMVDGLTEGITEQVIRELNAPIKSVDPASEKVCDCDLCRCYRRLKDIADRLTSDDRDFLYQLFDNYITEVGEHDWYRHCHSAKNNTDETLKST